MVISKAVRLRLLYPSNRRAGNRKPGGYIEGGAIASFAQVLYPALRIIDHGLGISCGMLLLIDNYDSFTWNLVHYLGELGAKVDVVRNDEITTQEALAKGARGIVISPGPCDPDRSGICLDVIGRNAALSRPVPILGVCLGHQAIGQHFGGRIIRAPMPMHGKVSRIRHRGDGVLKSLPMSFEATRYHSLIIDRKDFPDCLEVTATSADDHLIMALQHKTLPIHGVQFHPESIATQHGHEILRNFLTFLEG